MFEILIKTYYYSINMVISFIHSTHTFPTKTLITAAKIMYQLFIYREISNIRRSESQKLIDSCLILQLPLRNLLKPVSSFTKEVHPRLAKRPLKEMDV